jgi:hypothetical protein
MLELRRNSDQNPLSKVGQSAKRYFEDLSRDFTIMLFSESPSGSSPSRELKSRRRPYAAPVKAERPRCLLSSKPFLIACEMVVS